MTTLLDGDNLLLKLDRNTLILDKKLDGKLSHREIRKIDRLMSPADEDTWYAESSKREAVETLVKEIEERRAKFWTSKAEEERAAQQRVGGR